MAFIEVEGDLFSGDYDAIGHGVNCKGVMGAGIAKVFAQKWPNMESIYKALCIADWMQPGKVFPYYDGRQWIFNIASQRYPGADANLLRIQNSVGEALQIAEVYELRNLAIPQIGCGIGGLDVDDVRSVLSELGDSDWSNVDLIMVSLPSN